MGGKEGCKISLPQCRAKTGKFSEIYFLRAHQTETLDFRGCWLAVTIQQKIVVYCPPLHSIMQERYASNLLYCALCIIHIRAIHVDSGALQYILQPQYHRAPFRHFPAINGRYIIARDYHLKNSNAIRKSI